MEPAPVSLSILHSLSFTLSFIVCVLLYLSIHHTWLLSISLSHSIPTSLYISIHFSFSHSYSHCLLSLSLSLSLSHTHTPTPTPPHTHTPIHWLFIHLYLTILYGFIYTLSLSLPPIASFSPLPKLTLSFSVVLVVGTHLDEKVQKHLSSQNDTNRSEGPQNFGINEQQKYFWLSNAMLKLKMNLRCCWWGCWRCWCRWRWWYWRWHSI